MSCDTTASMAGGTAGVAVGMVIGGVLVFLVGVLLGMALCESRSFANGLTYRNRQRHRLINNGRPGPGLRTKDAPARWRTPLAGLASCCTFWAVLTARNRTREGCVSSVHERQAISGGREGLGLDRDRHQPRARHPARRRRGAAGARSDHGGALEGFHGRLGVTPQTLRLLEVRGVAAHVRQTEEAIRLYNELRETERVGALIRPTC